MTQENLRHLRVNILIQKQIKCTILTLGITFRPITTMIL
jgi:hypothetical protein